MRDVAKPIGGRAPRTNEWFYLKLKHGSSCTLHYKMLSANLVLDHSTQNPFYIDTTAMKVVYLERKANEQHQDIRQISCDDDSPDRTNKEVTIYTNRACCCSNNHIDAYGYVSCDDGWRDGDCW